MLFSGVTLQIGAWLLLAVSHPHPDPCGTACLTAGAPRVPAQPLVLIVKQFLACLSRAASDGLLGASRHAVTVLAPAAVPLAGQGSHFAAGAAALAPGTPVLPDVVVDASWPWLAQDHGNANEDEQGG